MRHRTGELPSLDDSSGTGLIAHVCAIIEVPPIPKSQVVVANGLETHIFLRYEITKVRILANLDETSARQCSKSRNATLGFGACAFANARQQFPVRIHQREQKCRPTFNLERCRPLKN